VVERNNRRRNIRILMGGKMDFFRALDEPYLNVFRQVLVQMDRVSNKWYSNKGNHKEIMNRCSISHSTLEKHLKKLKTKKLLQRLETEGRGVYLVNKELIEYE